MDTWLEIHDFPRPPVEWEVCGDCRRAYRRGECRRAWVLVEDTGEEELVELCPYPDCEASARHDAVDWAHLARAHPDSLPHLPERGVAYTW
jgi:hypothetical protein